MTNWKKVVFSGRKQLAETIKGAWEDAQAVPTCSSYRHYVYEIAIWDDGDNTSEAQFMAASEQKRCACTWGDVDDAKLLTVLTVKELKARPQFTDEEIKEMIAKWLKKFSQKIKKAA
jgi:hypothetical protein